MADVEIVIKTIDDASAQIKALNARVDELKAKLDGAKRSGEGYAGSQRQSGQATSDAAGKTAEMVAGLANLASAATKATAIIGTFKTAIRIGEEGAAVRQTAESFQRLMETVGANGDMLERLRAASRGTVDDLTLMSSTATLLAGTSNELGKALAEASPQILELAKAANKLNPTLGDTTFLYQSLMTGIKRGSPMLIDNTGLTLKLGDANEKMAQKLGKSVEQLSSEEQKLAILNATLEAGDNLLQQVGGTVDSQTDSFARLETATKNLGDALKAKLAPGLSSAAEGAAILLNWSSQVNAAYEKQIEVVNNTTTSYQDYFAAAVDAGIAAGKVSEGTQRNTEAYGDNQIAIWSTAVQLGILTEEEWNQARAAEATTAYMNSLGGSYTATASSAEQSAGATRDLAAELERVAALSEEATKAQANLASAQENYRAGVGSDLVGLLKDAGISGQDYKDALAAIDQAQGTNFATTERMNEEMAALVEQYKQTGDLAAFAEGVDNLSDSFEPFNKKISEAAMTLERVQRLLDELNGRQVEIGINIEQNGSIPGSTTTTPNPKPKPKPNGSAANGYTPQAAGGRFDAGDTILVGEFGPEIMRPAVGGTIAPTNATLQTGGQSVQNSYSISIFVTATDPRAAAREIEAILGDQARMAEVAGAQYQGR